MFADRPERVASHMRVTDFVAAWSKGVDSFAKDPPNADLSILDDDKVINEMVVLESVKLEDGTVVFRLKSIDGPVPSGRFGPASLFVDDMCSSVMPFADRYRDGRVRPRCTCTELAQRSPRANSLVSEPFNSKSVSAPRLPKKICQSAAAD